MPGVTHYQTLGVTPDATTQEIREAFIRLAEIHHPDKGGDGSVMADLNRAYTTLKNERKAYGLWLDMTMTRCSRCRGRGNVASGFHGKKKCSVCDGIGYKLKT